MVDVLIVGGGPAGLTAALYAARSGLSCLLLEEVFVGGQAATTSMLENYPGFPDGIGGPELAMAMEKQAKNAGAIIEYGAIKELALLGDIKRAKTAKREIEASSIILAMGAKRRKLGAKGEEEFIGRGVSYCATCDGALYKGKDVAVIGGGNTAAEDVLYLANMARSVTLIHRRDTLRATDVLAQHAVQAPKVKPLWNHVVTDIKGEGAVKALMAENVKTGEKQELPVDGVFIAVGTVPETRLIEGQIKLTKEGYVPAGEDCACEIPGVFAAGDLRQKTLRQVITAAADGAIAAAGAWAYLHA